MCRLRATFPNQPRDRGLGEIPSGYPGSRGEWFSRGRDPEPEYLRGSKRA